MTKRDPKTLRQYIQDFDKYWDYEKNKGIDPDSLSVNDSTKVYTKCPICNTSVLRNVRFSWKKDENGNGHIIHCRTCGKRNDKNALVKCFPDIVKYWDYDMNEHVPEYYAVSSGKRVYVRCPECGETKHRALCDTVTRGSDGKYKLSICEDCLKIPKIKRRFRKGDRLDVCYPDIEKLWVYEENLSRPEDLTPYSKEYVSIKCPGCGDVLYRRCYNSFKKDGDKYSIIPCHICGINNGVKEKASEKPISEACPDCIDWWDYDKNELSPNEVSHRSKQDISFICPECHYTFNRKLREFFTVHRDGSYLPVGCPSCGYAPRENPEENLLKLCPEIVDWWDYEKNDRLPEEFTPGSTYFASLICPDCGLRLHTGIHSLVKALEDGTVIIRHKGKCRKFKAMESENNLVLKYPDVMLWWDYEKNDPHLPEEYTTGSPFQAHFKCPECGAETYSRISDAFKLIDDVPQLFRCSYCSDIRVMPGINDLATTDEELAKEYSPNNERDVKTVRKSHCLPVKWICPRCTGEYRYFVNERSLGDNVCPYCTYKKVLSGYNDLKTNHEELLDKWAYVENTLMGVFPENELPNSTNKVWWRCPTCDYKYPLAIKRMILKQKRGHNPCPRCMGRRWTQTHYI